MENAGVNEKQWLQAVARGDHDAYRSLFVRYYPKVRFFILGLIKTESEAEDLAQDVFAKLWTIREKLTEVDSFGAYLYVLAKHTTLNYIQQKQARMYGLSAFTPEEEIEVTPYEELLAKDLQLLIDLVVSGMPSQRRIIYRMSREEGLSNAEIAEKLRLTKKTIENHLNLALKELRNALIMAVILFLC
ncbi:RNA polymerase sigma-70 factor [Bacteroides sp.]